MPFNALITKSHILQLLLLRFVKREIGFVVHLFFKIFLYSTTTPGILSKLCVWWGGGAVLKHLCYQEIKIRIRPV